MTAIGSSASCDIVLPGIEPLHTVVLHDEADEYILDTCGPETRLHGAVVVSSAAQTTRSAGADSNPAPVAAVTFARPRE